MLFYFRTIKPTSWEEFIDETRAVGYPFGPREGGLGYSLILSRKRRDGEGTEVGRGVDFELSNHRITPLKIPHSRILESVLGPIEERRGVRDKFTQTFRPFTPFLLRSSSVQPIAESRFKLFTDTGTHSTREPSGRYRDKE